MLLVVLEPALVIDYSSGAQAAVSISQSTVVATLCIGMDEVLAHYACTFENSNLHFHFQ